MIELTSYDDARSGFRSRELRQALYDAGHRLMTGVVVNLHGDEHVARRRLENRLFRRDTFAWYERTRIPSIVDSVLEPAIVAGRGELLTMAKRTMMRLSVDVAGVDLPSDSFERFYELMDHLAAASTVAHAAGDPASIIADGDEALESFRHEYFAASLERRAQLVASFERNEIDEAELPRDVLTTLLRNQDRLDLPAPTLLREVAYFPWVGSHSTSAQLVHAMHHIFAWIVTHRADRERLEQDGEFRQRFVHESMRLHPASPIAARVAVADLTLRSGVTIHQGQQVTINVESANRDEAAVGSDPEAFDPFRHLADGVPPWGLSFGTGPHACLGQELASGLEPDTLKQHLLGSVALMAGAILAAGARPDPDDPPALDTSTTRTMWGRYPVILGRPQ